MKIFSQLQKKIGKKVEKNIPLSIYSTFQLGGVAKYFFVAKNNQDVIKAATCAQELSLNTFILAGGSNLLISDNGFDGLVIKMENRDAKIIAPNFIKAQSGVFLVNLSILARDNSLSGMEWGADIPGTVGGAIRGNAGAFGCSMDQIVKSVEVLNLSDLKISVFNNNDCHFGYRDSIFKHNKNFIILSGLFSLSVGVNSVIKAEMKKNLHYRTQNQPRQPSAGCIFQNIIINEDNLAKLKTIDKGVEEKIKGGKLGSAWLIDRAGLKGYTIGGAQVSHQHANFIIKTGKNARADHVLQLISYIKQQVRDKYGIQLQEEIQYVGF